MFFLSNNRVLYDRSEYKASLVLDNLLNIDRLEENDNS